MLIRRGIENSSRPAMDSGAVLGSNRPDARDPARSAGLLRGPRGALPRRAPRPLLPDARLGPRRRRRDAGCAPARVAGDGGLRGPQCAAHLALPDRDQQLPAADRAPPAPGAPDRLRPAGRSPRRAGGSARRVRVGRALSGRRSRRRAGLARSALRAARERRAGVRGGAPAPAGAPAGGADPPRRARLLGRRDCRGPGDDDEGGLQRAAARARDDRGAPPRARPAADAARARRRARARARRALRRGVGRRRRRRRRLDARGGRDPRDAAAALVVPWHRRRARVPRQRTARPRANDTSRGSRMRTGRPRSRPATRWRTGRDWTFCRSSRSTTPGG